MSIQSPYHITFTPVGGAAIPLVAVGDWLARLPAFEAQQDIYEADGVLLDYAWFRPMGGASISLTLAIEWDAADHGAAQSAFLDGATLGGVSLLHVEGTLSFQPADEEADPTVFFPAVIHSRTPALPSGPVSSLVTELQITTTIPTP
jgi:hypothetical protein